MFFATISAEILRICRATSSVVQFIKTSTVFLHRMLRQGADHIGVKKVLVKMINRRHVLKFEKYNTNNRDLIQQLCINEGQIQTSLYDKRNSYNFNVVRFLYKSSTIPSKMFFAIISAEILRICRATSSVVQFIKTSKVFLHRMLRQGADHIGVKKVLVKMINRRHVLKFEKYNTNNRDLIRQLLT